jgi:F-type H+-transporting ATPase subunit gamma
VFSGSEVSPLTAVRDCKNVLIVVVSSNSGLCGTFNNSIIKETLRYINILKQSQSVNVSLVCIGKKAGDYFRKYTDYEIIGHYNEIFNGISYNTISELSINLVDLFLAKKYDKINIISNQSLNVATFKTINEQWLPFSADVEEQSNAINYIYMPDKQLVAENLMQVCLHQEFYCKLIESFTSEHGARMTSMHKATENAGEMLKSLKLSFNKARQAAITNEIIEITNGANALVN